MVTSKDRGRIFQSFPYYTMFNGYSEVRRELRDHEKNGFSFLLFFKLLPLLIGRILFPLLFPTKEESK